MVNNKIKRTNSVKKGLFLSFLIYVFLFIKYYVFADVNELQVENWVIYSQLLVSLEFVLLFLCFLRLDYRIIPVIIFIVALANTMAIRDLFVTNGFTAFGPDPIDANLYLDNAKRTANLSLSETLQYYSDETQLNYEFHVDDYGMSFIARLAYILGGDKNGYLFVMLVLNAIAIALSCKVLLKILVLLFEKDLVRVGIAFYGLFTGLQMIAVYGLKENFFLLFTLLSLLYGLKYLTNPSRKTFIFAILFILPICLFRFATAAQLFLALVSSAILKKSKHKALVFFVFAVGGLFALLSLNLIILLLGGSGLENMLIMAEIRNTSSSGSMVVEFVSQFIFSFIGQPALFTGEFTFSHIAIFSCLLRNLLAVFFVLGIVHIIKDFDERFWYFLAYWLLGSFMLIIAIRASDFRYSCLYFPAFIVLVLEGWRKRNEVPLKNLISLGVLGVVFIFIIGWN